MISILIGVSGAGKSTIAKKYLEINPNAVRINRDSLRLTLFGAEQTDSEYYAHKDLNSREKLITEVSEQMMYDFLNLNKDIILDNTNLDKKVIDTVIRKFNHLDNIELIFTHSDSEDEYKNIKERLLKRFDNNSDKIKYLDRQWESFKKLKSSLHGHQLFYPQFNVEVSFNENNPKTYLVDIDGTVALKGDRDIFDDSKLHLDTEIKPVGDVLRALSHQGYKIIYVSGRQDSCYSTTKKWLEDNNLWFKDSEMFMRKSKDNRPDYLIKEEIILNNILPNYNVIGVFDDRLQVTREYYRLGIFTFNVNQDLKQF